MTESAQKVDHRNAPANVTWWVSLTNPQGRRETTTWGSMFDHLRRIRPFEGERHPGWSAALFENDKRGLANLQQVTAAVLDYDDTTTIDRALKSWSGIFGFLHTTKKHTEDSHRFRVVLPLSRPVSAFEWRALWSRLDRHANGCLDPAAKDGSRFWYQSGVLEGHPFVARELDGDLLDVDGWLSKPDPVGASPAPAPVRIHDPSAVERRAIRYIARMPEAIAGSGGHNATWQVAVTLARGFGLGEDRTFQLLWSEYNPRCQPPWKEKELRHKAKQAQNARAPYGYLLDDDRDYEPRTYRAAPPEPELEPPEWMDDETPSDETPIADEAKQPSVVLVRSMHDILTSVAERAKQGVPEVGISACHYVLDELLGGFRRQRVAVLGARTSFGKSSYAIMVVDEALKAGENVILISTEDSEETFGQRFMARRAKVNAARLRVNRCKPEEVERMQQFAESAERLPFFIDGIGKPIEKILETVRTITSEHPPALLVFDYLQRAQTSRRTQDRRNEITYVAQRLGDATKELNAAGLFLSQLRRPETGNKNRPPTMFDLKECVTGEQIVADGRTGRLMTVRELVESSGTHVVALNAEWKSVVTTMASAWSTGVKPVYKLMTKSGRTLRATANHPLRLLGGWARLDALRVGQRIAVPRLVPEPSFAVDTLRDEELRMLGYLISDGHYGKHHAISFVTADEEVAADVYAMAPLWNVKALRQKCQGIAHQMNLTTGRPGCGNGVAKWLRELGIYGQTGASKVAPAVMFQQTNRALGIFLGALWSGDGSVFHRKNSGWSLKFTNTSPGLLDQVQWILTRLGIVSRREAPTRHTKSTVDIASIIIAEAAAIRRFAETVIIPGEKGRLLAMAAAQERLRENPRLDVMPLDVTEEVTRLSVASGVPYRFMKARLGYKPQGKHMSRASLAICADTFKSVEFGLLARSDVLWDEIVSIEPDGEDEVFDLSVPGLNNFVVANIFAHNSGDVENQAEHVLLGKLDEEHHGENMVERHRSISVQKNKDGPLPDASDEWVELPFDDVTASFRVKHGQRFGAVYEHLHDDFEDGFQ